MEYYKTWDMESLLIKKHELEEDNKGLSEDITFLKRKDRHTQADYEQLAFWRSQADLNRQHLAKIAEVIREREKKAKDYYNKYLEI